MLRFYNIETDQNKGYFGVRNDSSPVRFDEAVSKLINAFVRMQVEYLYLGLEQVTKVGVDIEKLRNEGHYYNIQRKIDNQQFVLDAEMLFYVLVTNDISKIDNNVLAQLLAQHSRDVFGPYLKIIQLVNAWNTYGDKAPDLQKQICDALKTRHQLNNKGRQQVLFLNLSGAKLSGIDFVGAGELYAINFSEADLSHARFPNLSKLFLRRATLHNAKFIYQEFKNPDENVYVHLVNHCDAEGADLTKSYGEKLQWEYSNFNHANMSDSRLKFVCSNVTFFRAQFNNCGPTFDNHKSGMNF